MFQSIGNVGIGTASPGSRLAISVGAVVGSSYAGMAVGDGDIAYTGNIYDVSDIRLKENITPLENAIEKVSALHGIYFNLKGESISKREAGVIAQDVEAVLPED